MVRQWAAAYGRHRVAAEEAETLLDSWTRERLPRVPGVSTVIRLAWRIECGRSVEEAAGREYLYRWHLDLQSRACFGVPYTLGV